jgi:predicted short-subunit dehydrogenase-like oxidoreductase (DUF2520 family)
MKVRILGAGRAGGSFQRALSEVGVDAELVAVRPNLDNGSLAKAAHGQDAVLLAVSDRHVAGVARLLEPDESCVILHCSGSLGLGVLEMGKGGPHRRVASLHPLATLPDPVVGSLRLQGGTFFAVSGDQVATDLAFLLGGRPIVVAEEHRAVYHAAACVAANHLVALLGQVERIAEQAGLPLEAFLPLARGALDDVSMLGPEKALTGPAARRDLATLEAHRAVLPAEETEGYEAGVRLASRLSGESAERRSPAGASPWS